MHPHLNEKKSTQLAARIIQLREVGKISHLKLMKLMYLVDREALLRWGWSVTGDAYTIMPYGMALSGTLNLISDEQLADSYWKHHISAPEDYEVALLNDPTFDELSEADLELIDEVYQKFGHLNRWALVKFHHDNLPEWEDPGKTSYRIDYKEVLQKAGKSEHEIEEIISSLEEVEWFERLAA